MYYIFGTIGGFFGAYVAWAAEAGFWLSLLSITFMAACGASLASLTEEQP